MILAQAPPALQTAARVALGKTSAAGRASLQQAKIVPSDAAIGDSFGYSVAVSGTTALVGADQKNSGAGVAYVFLLSGTTWSQQAKLKAVGGASNDLFGYSVAVSGSIAVVGAPGRSSGKGSAYVFVLTGTTWSQQAILTASDGVAGDNLGISVAVSGSTAVVGAYNKNFTTGAAYVFVRKVTTWSQRAELTASDGAAFDGFGYSVAISGTTALVGAYGNSSSAGAAYVFERSGTTWPQQARLTGSDGVSGDLFGYSVALSGSTALVGACCKDSSTGAAYLYERSGTTWPQQPKLSASDGVPGDHFGSSVALSGSVAVVGAYGPNSNTGAAYAFVPSGTTWVQQAKLTASDGAPNDNFALSVALSGTTAVVGAYGQSSNTGAAYVFALPSEEAKLTATDGLTGDYLGISVAVSGTTAVVGTSDKNNGVGAAYVFGRTGTIWYQQAKLTASDGAPKDHFGYSVALDGTTAVVGAFQNGVSIGAAYVFVGSGSTWTQRAKLTAADGALNDFFGGSVAISGTTAVVGASGKNSNIGAAYVFVRSGTTWSQQAKLTPSDGALKDFFGGSVAISGTTVLVGASGKKRNTGSAYVFVRSMTTWSQQAELTAPDTLSHGYFGHSVAVSGSTALVGADARNFHTGAAYVFVRSGTTWSHQVVVLTASDGAAYDSFGISVALSGSTALVGAYVANSNVGAAYVFVHSRSGWSEEAKLTAFDGRSFDYFGASVALSGSLALVGGEGNNSNTGAAYLFVLP
jgi:hypothetical protein